MYIQIEKNGWEYLKKTVGEDYIKYSIKPYKEEINDEIWYKLQIHHVFELFPINLGVFNLFNNDILFHEEDLKDY